MAPRDSELRSGPVAHLLALGLVKALFFSPFANIWEHSYPEALVAQSLADRGFSVKTVRCDGLFEGFCVAMSASGLTAASPLSKRRQVCSACHKRRNLIDGHFGFDHTLMESVLITEDYDFASEIARSVERHTWLELSIDGIPIGRYAAYEFLLKYKVLGTDIPEEIFWIYRDQLRISILALRASQRILEAEQPDAVITYNRLYGVNHAFLAVAEQRGIPTYSLQGGPHVTYRGESMTMFLDSYSAWNAIDSTSWHEFENTPLSQSEIELVNSHLDGLMEASSAFAYSSAFEAAEPDDVRARFGISEDAPVLLIPMSSEDELNAAELADLVPDTQGRPNLFEDQFAWIRFLFDAARQRPDYSFILRLHPRMYPNKRENVVAPVVERVMKLIEEAPANVIVNLPSDNVSIYDLIQIVDVLLGYRSSVGVEFAAFGVPVVSPANKEFFTYPLSIGKTATSREQFIEFIDGAVDEGWALENMRAAYRWFAYLFTRIAADFSGSVRSRPIAIRPKKPGLRLWLWRKMVFLVIQFGPLVRERLALRRAGVADSVKDVFAEVVQNRLVGLPESSRWPVRSSTLDAETQGLVTRLEFLDGSLWSSFKGQRSLAQRIDGWLTSH